MARIDTESLFSSVSDFGATVKELKNIKAISENVYAAGKELTEMKGILDKKVQSISDSAVELIRSANNSSSAVGKFESSVSDLENKISGGIKDNSDKIYLEIERTASSVTEQLKLLEITEHDSFNLLDSKVTNGNKANLDKLSEVNNNFFSRIGSIEKTLSNLERAASELSRDNADLKSKLSDIYAKTNGILAFAIISALCALGSVGYIVYSLFF